MHSKKIAASFGFFLLIAGLFWLKEGSLPSFSRSPGVDSSHSASNPTSPTSHESASFLQEKPAEVAKNAVASSAPIDSAPTSKDAHLDTLAGQILASNNDNDPRLDTELRILPAGARRLLRARYQALPAEKRNERGTLVFLLGRNIRDQADLTFLAEVTAEPPCRSLADCSRDANESVAAEDMHHESGTEVTLAYPQLTALKMLERSLRENPSDWPLREPIFRQLREAEKSSISKVATQARDILARLDSSSLE